MARHRAADNRINDRRDESGGILDLTPHYKAHTPHHGDQSAGLENERTGTLNHHKEQTGSPLQYSSVLPLPLVGLTATYGV